MAETVVETRCGGFTVECVNGNSFGQGNVDMIHKVNADMLES